jgi:UTP--glucose-1-phosphate uridylyltransferase
VSALPPEPSESAAHRGRDAEQSCRQRMQAAGLPQLVIETFAHYHRQLVDGADGLIPEASLQPVGELPELTQLGTQLRHTGEEALARTAVIKLNGGLGTSMGLERAKSLLQIRPGLTFLHAILKQCQQAQAPLLLMNSYATRQDTLACLGSDEQGALPRDFVQHRVPKIWCDNLHPVDWPAQPSLEWCPPGHGDIYTALVTTGLLEQLLANGFSYAFVSNADNLGATLEPVILGYMQLQQLPFVMEVTQRTSADRKGGHLARRTDGRLLLREAAQCPPEDTASFGDIHRHRYFNTNNLWMDLRALQRQLDRCHGVLGLPLIRNRKTVDPRNPDSPSVYQLETAMGAAIESFAGAGALVVPRTRFSPVKTTSDLLAVRSDAYVITASHHAVLNPQRTTSAPPHITLDPRYYTLVDDLDLRFAHGVPSLVDCSRLEVRGDVRFGRDVRIVGAVSLESPPGEVLYIQDGAVLGGL